MIKWSVDLVCCLYERFFYPTELSWTSKKLEFSMYVQAQYKLAGNSDSVTQSES